MNFDVVTSRIPHSGTGLDKNLFFTLRQSVVNPASYKTSLDKNWNLDSIYLPIWIGTRHIKTTDIYIYFLKINNNKL